MVEIQDLTFRLDPDPHRPEIRALVSLKYGELVVRQIKIIRAASGRIRINFPDIPVGSACPNCDKRIAITHRFCCHCGTRQPFRMPEISPGTGRPHKYNSVVFPCSAEARAAMELVILRAFVEATTTRAKAS